MEKSLFKMSAVEWKTSGSIANNSAQRWNIETPGL